ELGQGREAAAGWLQSTGSNGTSGSARLCWCGVLLPLQFTSFEYQRQGQGGGGTRFLLKLHLASSSLYSRRHVL
ncbi:hypothetical protein AVDCRST_MAG94-4709, partial [uncultured Leptolyngbya sp.]